MSVWLGSIHEIKESSFLRSQLTVIRISERLSLGNGRGNADDRFPNANKASLTLKQKREDCLIAYSFKVSEENNTNGYSPLLVAMQTR